MGVFGYWNGLVCNFWCNLGKSFCCSDSISEVSSQSVVGECCGIVGWGTNKNLPGVTWNYAGMANSQKAREDGDKGL